MRDRTAQTEPLTIGQQLVARWEDVNSGWGEPADLAEAIDDVIAAARSAALEQAAAEMDRRAHEARAAGANFSAGGHARDAERHENYGTAYASAAVAMRALKT